jgi:hypothetical protein
MSAKPFLWHPSFRSMIRKWRSFPLEVWHKRYKLAI